jgi:cellulose synthase/poly-beta-1,6-N-acetylglucosamine synthase-like glycosyltransferase
MNGGCVGVMAAPPYHPPSVAQIALLPSVFSHPTFLFDNELLRQAVRGAEGPHWATLILLLIYAALLLLLSFYGSHRFALVRRWWTRRKQHPMVPAALAEEALPGVTVQLPLFNEASVVERIIRNAAQLDWPRDRLSIQVLDDSTDETTLLARRVVAELASTGLDIVLLHRTDRTGFKAGALAAGLAATEHPFVAVFDADFVPRPDFLRQLMPHFQEPDVGVVQARWAHLNEQASALTRLQGVMLDGHFRIEHVARTRHGLYMNFNGTAGIWRKATIEAAGGWHHETLTEDLDLSYRAQLLGWRFVYRDDVTCPSELPESMTAFKTQQHRWAKGSIQVMRKLLGTVMSAPVPWRIRKEAFFHLTGNLCYLAAVPVFLFTLPMLMLRARLLEGWAGVVMDIGMFLAATGSVVLFLVATLAARGFRWRDLVLVPGLLALGTALSLNQTRAVIEALCGHQSAFVRTPKSSGGGQRYLGAKSFIVLAEFLGALYSSVILFYALQQGLWTALPFCGLFFAGYWYVVILTVFESRKTNNTALAPSLAAS